MLEHLNLEHDRPDRCTRVHGVLVNVLDTGVLLTGESGTGKSECALGLIDRGYALVADDVVDLFDRDGYVAGRACSLLTDFLEVRGLGIVNVREVFGEFSVREESKVDMCIEFTAGRDNDRLAGFDECEFAGHHLPRLIVPVDERRDMPLVVVTAVRAFKARRDSPDFLERHAALMGLVA